MLNKQTDNHNDGGMPKGYRSPPKEQTIGKLEKLRHNINKVVMGHISKHKISICEHTAM